MQEIRWETYEQNKETKKYKKDIEKNTAENEPQKGSKKGRI